MTDFFGSFKHLYFKQGLPQHNCTKVSKYVHLLGKPNNATVVEIEKSVLAACGYGEGSYKVYFRMLFHNLKINSCKWNKNSHHRKNNSVIGYYFPNSNSIEYGIIQNFFLINSGTPSPSVLVTILKLFKHDTVKVQTNSSPHRSVSHIVACLPPTHNPDDIIAIPLEHIHTPCVFISFDGIQDHIYVAALINLTEKD